MDRVEEYSNTWKRARILVTEFSTPEHANAALNYKILIGREVYAGMVFNRTCKSIQCF